MVTAEIKIGQIHELIQDFVLICYDLPATARTLRREFLKAAHAIGAVKHTDSVYLLPYSEKAMAWAGMLESAGHAVVWKAHQPDKGIAIEITANYDKAVQARCDYIQTRINLSQDYIEKGKLKMPIKMLGKTMRLLKEVVQIGQNFNPPWLNSRIQNLFEQIKTIYKVVDNGNKG